MPSHLLLIAFATLAASAPAVERRFASLPPKFTSIVLGNTTSNFANIFRDGGGGGKVNGINFIMFSDGIYTTGGPPKSDNSNWANFTSNSIAASGFDGKGPLSLQDFGTAAQGPNQAVPFFYNDGENDATTGIWPNNGITTLSSGAGVLFPQVVDRQAIARGEDGTLYNTGVTIGVGAFGPYISRPVKALFRKGELQYGLFGSLAGLDGYLYMYAPISGTVSSNGLKMARVPQGSWSDLTQYSYWDGAAFQSTPPPLDDGGKANVFSYSQSGFGKTYGPGTGDMFYNNFYGVYMIIFQAADAALDASVYMSYSSDATKGWSKPTSIFQIPPIFDGYSYGFHAYPHYDETHRVIVLSWSAFSKSEGYIIGMANVTFT